VRFGAIDYLLKPTPADGIVLSLLGAPLRAVADDNYEVATVYDVRWEYSQEHFAKAGYNISETTRRLKMHRRSLQRILKYGPPDEYQPLLG
jgi:two-component system response regulator RegA